MEIRFGHHVYNPTLRSVFVPICSVAALFAVYSAIMLLTWLVSYFYRLFPRESSILPRRSKEIITADESTKLILDDKSSRTEGTYPASPLTHVGVRVVTWNVNGQPPDGCGDLLLGIKIIPLQTLKKWAVNLVLVWM